MKSSKIRLKLNYRQKLILETLANEHRFLYNHLLDKTKETSDFKELNIFSQEYRHTNDLTVYSKSAQNTCRGLIANILSFYALHKKNDKAKFPHKFKGYKYFCTFTLDWNNSGGGFKLYDNILSLRLNHDKNRIDFKLSDYFDSNVINENTIKTIKFSKDEFDRYFVSFSYSENLSNNNVLDKSDFLSIDIGVDNIATCFSNKVDPLIIKNNKFKKLERRIEHVQSLRDKKKKRSSRHNRLSKKYRSLNRKLSNRNKDFQHKASKKIVDICIENEIGTLIIGDIKTKKLIKEYAHGLNKSTQNRGTLSRFKSFLDYKTKSANIDFYKVNEAYTSQINCLNGKKELSSNLSVRKVKLCDNIEISRDLNSAVNIAKKIKAIWLSQYDNFLISTLKNCHEMYIDCSSNLCMI
mgnify:CR=1 FL=1